MRALLENALHVFGSVSSSVISSPEMPCKRKRKEVLEILQNTH